MKKILPEYAFTQAQLHIVSQLAKTVGLTEHTTRILYARGVDTAEKIQKFMSPSRKNFLSPYLMRGMKEAVEMLENARDEEKTVVVFGDYDADGICASTILSEALKIFGIEPHVYVPERTDGYGLSVEMIDRIFDECQPDLFVTVDCGISCAKEAQYIYELGADIIITDHHELPETLPSCVIINPKLDDDYPYDNLCGAGVAFKLAQALIGDRAFEFLDFAALATVADSVPLLGENRDIVTEGLKLFNESPRLCFSCILGKAYDEITAQVLAFNVAPRVNAAGRMGDARAALELFCARDDERIAALAEKLCVYNVERQKYCDELYLSAKEKLNKKGAYGQVIMLSDEQWNAGFVGIVAARLAEEYNRPTLLFVHNGGMLKGSARSIENVNIFNALKNCSQYIAEFGGHAQAAGINIEESNFDALEKALCAEIEKCYEREDLQQRIFVSEELDEPISPKFARELVKLEPYGVGHKRPYFSMRVRSCAVKRVKEESPHLSIRTDKLEFMYFSGAKHVDVIESDVEKQFVFELNVSRYRGKEYIKGFVRDVVYDGKTGEDVAEQIFYQELLKLRLQDRQVRVQALSTAQIEEIIKQKTAECAFGLCVIASDRRSMKRYQNLDGLGCDLFYPAGRNVANVLLIAPQADVDLSGFREFVFLDRPTGFYHTALEQKPVYVGSDICGYSSFLRLDCKRERLLDIYAEFRRNASALSGDNPLQLAIRYDGLGFDKKQFIFALCVFEELGLIGFSRGAPVVFKGAKAELASSTLYQKVNLMKEEIALA